MRTRRVERKKDGITRQDIIRLAWEINKRSINSVLKSDKSVFSD